jgi:hypothetical protein
MTCSGRILLPCSCNWDGAHLYCFHDDAFHASGFLGQDTGILKLDAVTQVYAVLGHGQLAKMIKPDVPVVFLDPGFNSTPCLSNLDLTTLIQDAVNAWCIQTKIILVKSKESGYLPRQKADSFNGMSC